MPILIPYLVKLFISLNIIFLFYQLVLRRLTFYNANRWYFIGFTFLAFLAPFIDVTTVVTNNAGAGSLAQYIPAIQAYSIGLADATHCPMPLWSSTWTKWDWLLLCLAIGAGLLLIRFIVRCLSFYKLRSNAKLLSSDGLRVYQVDASIIPFSFGNSIFINSTQHSEEELREIIRHEFIHVKQRHTLDILWAELLCMLCWYNPAAWLLRNSMRQNLEFIADHQVLENGVDRKQYQYLLLKVIGNDQFSIAHKFNFSSLKKRIAMMNKSKTRRVHLLRFLFVLPVLAIILLSFRDQLGNNSTQSHEPTDTIPEIKEVNAKGYIIDIKDNKGECMVVVKDKKGKTIEKLPLTKWHDNESFYESKYGVIAPPPAPEELAVLVEVPAPPRPGEPATPGIPEAPPAPGAPMMPTKLLTQSDDFEITSTRAIIHLKDGTTEKYDLTKKSEKDKFEKRWGKIIETSETAPVAIFKHDDGEVVIAPIEPSTLVPSKDAVLAVDPTGHIINGNEDVIITITKYTTRQQLEELKSQMKAKSVELSFDQIEYNSKGILISITGTMKSGESKSNFVATDFQKLVLAMVKSNGRTYLKVSTSNNKEVVSVPATSKTQGTRVNWDNFMSFIKPAC